MDIVSWTLYVSFLFLLVSSTIVKPDQKALLNDQSNINVDEYFDYADKILQFKDKYTDVVNRFRCPQGWRRFGGSCYHLSNVTSTSIEANETCNHLYLNNSQLMQIRHPVEIYYAAHILMQNDLSGLLLQISPHLLKGKKSFDEIFLNDTASWQSAEDKFQQIRLNYYNEKTKTDNLQYDNEFDGSSNIQTTSATQNEKNYSEKNTVDSSVVFSDSERFGDIHSVCDRLVWDAHDNNEDIFILTRYSISNKMTCSIHNIEIDRSYEYVCQYVLDFCFANTICGPHGRCVNNLMNLRCSCYFYMDGPLCQQISTVFIQLCVCFVVIFVLWLLTTSPLQNCQRRLIQKLDDHFKPHPTTPDLEENNANNNDNSSEQISTEDCEKESPNNICLFWRCCLMFIIFCLLCIIPSWYQWKSLQFHSNDRLELDLLITNTVQSITQCKNSSIISTHNLIFIPTSLILCLIFSYFVKRKKHCLTVCNGRPGCLSPIKPFTTVNRYETAALCGLVVFDVLTALEQFFVDISQLWKQGVLIQFLDRTLIPLIYSLRYYPLFLSLQHRNRYVRCLAFIYILLNVGYIVVRQSLCMDFLSLSKSFSAIEETKRRLKHRNWIIVYGLIKSIPQFILLSYIVVELFLRIFYNSSSQSDITNSNNADLSPATTNKSVTSSSNDISNISSKIKKLFIDFWSDVKNFPGWIYRLDKNFRYTTMAVCVFTVAFVLLCYLTCSFSFQFIMGTSSMSIVMLCLEYIFNIDIKNWSFHTEILISAIFTMIIFAKRILREMMKYKKHTNDLKNNNYEEIPRLDQSEQQSVGHKSVAYLSSVFLNIVGSYFIWFHLILFIVLIFRLIFSLFRPSTFQEDVRRFSSPLFLFIAPVFVLYQLKNSITEWLCIFIPSHQPENRKNAANPKIHAILTYFTFIISCHIAVVSSILRLSKATLFNILLMPRVDSSYFSQKWQKKDDQYMAYVAYLYMEKAYRQSLSPSPPLSKECGIQVSIAIPSEECGTQVSIDDLNEFEEIDWKDTIDEMSDTSTQRGIESGEEDSSRSSTPTPETDCDDKISIASRTSSIVQRRVTIKAPKDQIFSSFGAAQGVDINNQQFSHNHQYDSHSETNQSSSRREAQPLLTSKSDDSEDEDYRPPLPPKNLKKTVSKSYENRFHSDEV